MLHREVLSPDTLSLLVRLARLPGFAELRLVGGTSLALQFGHRTSVDLDYCGSFFPGGAGGLQSHLAGVGRLAVVAESPNVHVYTLDGVKVDVVTSSAPWLEEAVLCDGFRLAAPIDIAAMKLQAIINRGARKDFVDLAVLLESFTLRTMVQAYRGKYGGDSLFALYKSIVYFDDAEEEPMPTMLRDLAWPEVRARVEAAARRFLRARAAPAP